MYYRRDPFSERFAAPTMLAAWIKSDLQGLEVFNSYKRKKND